MYIFANRRFASSLLVVIASGLTAITGVSYYASLNLAIINTIENELPLAGDTVYSEIQKDLIRPIYISSEMANNAFLRSWIVDGENDSSKINSYLSEVRRKHGLVSCFFVSASTRRYYYPEGMLKVVSPEAKEDDWFFRLVEMEDDFEVNIEPDAANNDELTVFVNYRMFDFNDRFIGATGLGVPLSRVLMSVKRYGSQFNRRILLLDGAGNIVAESDGGGTITHIRDKPGLSTLYDQIVVSSSSAARSLEYRNPLNNHLTRVNVRYLPELGWSLILEKDDESHNALQILKFTTPIALLTIAVLGAMWMRRWRIEKLSLQHKIEMLAVASHDLKHFVHTFYVLLASVADTCTLRKNQWACIEMEKVITGLDELISRFLAYYRLDAGADRPQFSAVKLSELLAQIKSEAAPQLEAQHRGFYVTQAPDCWVATDPVLFKVILRNFLSNAVKYADEGDVTVEVSVNTRKDRVEIYISNAGISLTPRELQQIFKKFVRGSKRKNDDGLGLGLHLVAYYASKLGCSVGARSRKHGPGTTFWVTVPIADQSLIANTVLRHKGTQSIISYMEHPFSNKQIAVINAPPFVCNLLEKWGALVKTYPSIEIFLGSREEQFKPNAILIDGEFLKKASGDLNFERLRQSIDVKIPVIIICEIGSVTPTAESKCHNVSYISKPINAGKLKLVLLRDISDTQPQLNP